MSKGRLEAYSDGVFAIVATLLVLELKVPAVHAGDASPGLLVALLPLGPKLLSYVLSFALVTVLWVNHHQLFHAIQRADRGLLWANGLFLMFLAFTPFPTALLGDYPRETAALVSFGAAMLLVSLAFALMRWHASFAGRLLDPRLGREKLVRGMRRGLVGPGLYVIGMAAATSSSLAAWLCFLAVPVVYALPASTDRNADTGGSGEREES